MLKEEKKAVIFQRSDEVPHCQEKLSIDVEVMRCVNRDTSHLANVRYEERLWASLAP